MRSPQRVFLRRAVFQVHLWLGIILSLYSIAIGLSGAILVFHEEIEHALYHQQLAIHSRPHPLALAPVVSAIEAARPGWRVVGLNHVSAKEEPITALMRSKAAPASTNLRYVSFDPNTGSVLQDRMRYAGFLGWTFHLHLYLLADRAGLTVSGCMAIGLLLLCLTGIVVWWPGVARWKRALVLRKSVGWRRLNWDLHSVVGFWTCLALSAVVFTGIYFAFALPVGGAIVKLTGGSLRDALFYVYPPKATPVPAGTPVISVDKAVRTLTAATAPAGQLDYLQLPLSPSDVYSGIGYYPGAVRYARSLRASLDPHTGKMLRVADTSHAPLGIRIVQVLHSIHFGTFAGQGFADKLVRALWVLIGIAPALLAGTGMLMYWNRKLRPLMRRTS